MRTIEIKLYSFDELTDEAKVKAIDNVRNQDGYGDDFGRWAVDDCALLEPSEAELVELFGEDYKFPLIKNTRKDIYFSSGRNWFLNVEKAIDVTNDEHFLTWLGVPKSLQDKICYSIYTPKYRNSDTTIEFAEVTDEDFTGAEEIILEDAKVKFDDHIKDVLKRIENDIDYRYSDEAVAEDIEANEYEFLECGELTNY